jgi:hypothetical protein
LIIIGPTNYLAKDKLCAMLKENDKAYLGQEGKIKTMEAKFKGQDEKFKNQNKKVQEKNK